MIYMFIINCHFILAFCVNALNRMILVIVIISNTMRLFFMENPPLISESTFL